LKKQLAALTLVFVSGFSAVSTCYCEPLFEEQFQNPSSVNQNVASHGWSGYGGGSAIDLSNSFDAELNGTLLISCAIGNPASSQGFLAAVLNEYKEYAVVKSKLNLKNPGIFSWRMNASSGSSLSVRLLIEVEGKWYASRETFTPIAFGTSVDFSRAEPKEVETIFNFNRNAANWAYFRLQPGASLAVGDAVMENLPSSAVTGIGFYVYRSTNNSGILRIDTMQVLP